MMPPMGDLLVVLGLGAFAVLAWRRPRVAGLVVVAALPAYVMRFSLGGLPTTLLEQLILVYVLTVLIRAIFHKQAQRIEQVFRPLAFTWGPPLALVVIASIVAIAVAPDTWAALGLWRAFFVEPVLLATAFLVVYTSRDLPWLVAALSVGALGVSLVSILQALTGHGLALYGTLPISPTGILRFPSVYPEANFVSLFVTPILVLCAGTILTGWKRLRAAHPALPILLTATVIAGVTALLLSQSRGGLASLFVGLVALTFFLRKQRATIIVAALLMLALAFAIPVTRERLLEVRAGRSDVSTDVRVVLWQGTTRLLRDHPLLGVGWGGFPHAYPMYKLPQHTELLATPHNLILDIWVTLGLLGTIGFAWLLVVAFRALRRVYKDAAPADRQWADVLTATLLAWLAYGLIDTTYFKNDLAALFWALLAFVIIASGSRAPRRFFDR